MNGIQIGVERTKATDLIECVRCSMILYFVETNLYSNAFA